jgi:hypothetical protein
MIVAVHVRGGDMAMKHFATSLLVVCVTVLVTPAATHANILLGVPGALTGAEAWLGEQLLEGTD